MLDEVKQYLTDQYFSRGKYAVRVDTKVTDLPGNKVDVIVDIKEGKRARIRQINVVGDTKFKEKDVLNTLRAEDAELAVLVQAGRPLLARVADRATSKSSARTTWTAATPISRSSRRRSRIAPEKDDMFITVNVNEGEVFKVSEIKLAGTMVVPEAELRRLLLIHPGDVFSRKAGHQLAGTDELPPRRRRLRVLEDRSGADRRTTRRRPCR